jgi:hypothetical protein
MLARAAILAVVAGLSACGGKKAAAPEQSVDLAAIRARRDSVRRVAAADSVARAKFTACSDSVTAALAQAAKKTKKKGAPPAPAMPAGMIPPEVLTACGKPPALAPTQVAQVAPAKSDSAAHLVTARPDSAKGAPAAKKDTVKVAAPVTAAKKDTAKTAAPGTAAKKDTAKTVAAAPAGKKDTAKVEAPAKPALTAKQLQVLRADSIRQARERARQDSLKQLAERARQDSVLKAQRDSTRAESLKVARETEVLRETFTYTGGARDPFASLITEEKVGPEFNDLLLVGVYLDLRRASNSVAVLRDKTNSKRYKLRVGDRVGRLKVAQIRQTDVVFTVEDIGFERQETLSLRKREDQTP